MTVLTRQRGALASQLFGTEAGDGWWRRAACASHDPELFHGLSEAEKSAAISICRECPVAAPCLAEAYQLGDDDGVRGALTAEQRRAERRHRERGGLRHCQRCRVPFTATAVHQRFCSKACRLAAGHAMKVTAGRAATRIGQEAHA